MIYLCILHASSNIKKDKLLEVHNEQSMHINSLLQNKYLYFISFNIMPFKVHPLNKNIEKH